MEGPRERRRKEMRENRKAGGLEGWKGGRKGR